MRKRRISPKEAIATHLGFDLAEMNGYAYQPGSYPCAVYAIGDAYYAAPARKSQLPGDFAWAKAGQALGRDVYAAQVQSA